MAKAASARSSAVFGRAGTVLLLCFALACSESSMSSSKGSGGATAQGYGSGASGPRGGASGGGVENGDGGYSGDASTDVDAGRGGAGSIDTVGGSIDTVGGSIDTVGESIDTVGESIDTVGGSMDTAGESIDTVVDGQACVHPDVNCSNGYVLDRYGCLACASGADSGGGAVDQGSAGDASRPVSVDGRDGSSVRMDAGRDSGIPCGTAVCGSGQYCCDPSCSQCAPLGSACALGCGGWGSL
jgi:hypothetical protein